MTRVDRALRRIRLLEILSADAGGSNATYETWNRTARAFPAIWHEASGGSRRTDDVDARWDALRELDDALAEEQKEVVDASRS